MTVETQGKELRDRFIAFSFAASDFLLEISPEGYVVFSAGQALSLTGYDSSQLNDKDFVTLFAETDHGNLKALLKGVKRAGRVGPLMVEIIHCKTKEKQRALLMGMTLPNSDNVYLTLNATQSFLDFLAIGDFTDHRLLDEKEFESAAIKAFQSAKREGKNLDVTFLDTAEIEEYKKGLSIDEANSFNENLQSLLKEQSFEGHTASQVDSDKYAIIHDEAITPEFIESKIQELVKRTTPTAENVDVKRTTIEADMETLNEREARRALIYTINQIEKGGLDAAGGDLSKSFDDYLQENAHKITSLKTLVGKQAFSLNFQPILHIPEETVCHYEALVRFDSRKSPYELIVFGEDIGIAADIDIAVLKQAIGYLKFHTRKDPDLRIAVNVSGQSIQSATFFDKVLAAIDEHETSPDNLLFEVTESTAIEDLDLVNSYIQRLREKGFEVCLDDFGAGAASFQYLNALDIDCVKIDGKYIRDALNSSRDEAMVRNLSRMCQDLGVSTVAEMVETQEQLDYLVSIGVNKAQGWLFSKPTKQARYKGRVEE